MYWASNILLGETENWNVLALWATEVQNNLLHMKQCNKNILGQPHNLKGKNLRQNIVFKA